MLLDLDDTSTEFEEVYEIPPTEQPPPPPPNEATASEDITKKIIKTGGIEFQSENIEELKIPLLQSFFVFNSCL